MTGREQHLAAAAFEAAPVGMMIVSPDEQGRVMYANPALAAMLDIDVDGLRGRCVAEFLHPGDRDRWRGRLAGLTSADTAPQRFRMRHLPGAGETVHAEVVMAYAEVVDGPAVIAHVRDVTLEVRAEEEHERLEQAMRRSQRMETMGQLASGVAHDFNNLLSVIVNYTQFSLDELGEHPAAADLREVLAAATRGAALTQQLLVVACRESPRVDTLDVNEVVRETKTLLDRTLGGHVDLEVSCSGSPLVLANRSQMEQVVLNLVINARDALPHGGRVHLSSEVVTHDGRRWARLRVQDDGIGMTQELQQRIFNPFFSTKDESRGSGLGLAIVYGIVTRAGGAIEVDSEPGTGTVFTVRFPIHPEQPSAPVVGTSTLSTP